MESMGNNRFNQYGDRILETENKVHVEDHKLSNTLYDMQAGFHAKTHKNKNSSKL